MIEAYNYFTTMPGFVIGALVLLNLGFSALNYWQSCRLLSEEKKARNQAIQRLVSDDVTAEGVDAMRQRAKKAIDAEEWVVVDG